MSLASTMSARAGLRLLAAPALASVILLAGCGGGASGGTAAPATTSAATSAATSAEPASSSGAATPEDSSSPAAPAAPAVKVPACATAVSDAGEGYAVKLPCGYTRITNKAELEAIMKKGLSEVKGNINITPEQLAQAKLFAVNPKTGSRINLVITPAGGMTGKDLASQSADIKKQLESVGATNMAFSDITVAGDQALRAKATMVTKSTKLQMVQVYAVHSDKAYIWTFTGFKPMPTEEALILGTLTFS